MNTDTNLMQNIDALWDTPEAMLIGHGEGFDEAIDRDQAVDEDGKAIFKSYTLSLDLGGEYFDPRIIDIKFTAEDMEAYAQTW